MLPLVDALSFFLPAGEAVGLRSLLRLGMTFMDDMRRRSMSSSRTVSSSADQISFFSLHHVQRMRSASDFCNDSVAQRRRCRRRFQDFPYLPVQKNWFTSCLSLLMLADPHQTMDLEFAPRIESSGKS